MLYWNVAPERSMSVAPIRWRTLFFFFGWTKHAAWSKHVNAAYWPGDFFLEDRHRVDNVNTHLCGAKSPITCNQVGVALSGNESRFCFCAMGNWGLPWYPSRTNPSRLVPWSSSLQRHAIWRMNGYHSGQGWHWLISWACQLWRRYNDMYVGQHAATHGNGSRHLILWWWRRHLSMEAGTWYYHYIGPYAHSRFDISGVSNTERDVCIELLLNQEEWKYSCKAITVHLRMIHLFPAF